MALSSPKDGRRAVRPIRKTPLDIIESKGPLHMSRDLDPLPGGQVTVNFASGGFELGLHRLNFGIEIEGVFVRMIADFLQAALQFHDRFFEVERLGLFHVTP